MYVLSIPKQMAEVLKWQIFFLRQIIMCSATVLREFSSVTALKKTVAVLQALWLFSYAMRPNADI